MGRPTDYDKKVKPYLDDVKKWVEAGATNKEVADALGIAESTVCAYKNRYKDFANAFTRGRVAVCCEIKAALLKKALGFHYEETRTSITDDDAKGVKSYTEKIKRYCVPSETAAAMLLRNYDNDWRDGDETSTRLKKQEHELKKRIAEAQNWLKDEGDDK